MGEDKKIQITCPNPECAKVKDINVPKYLFDRKQFGTLKIQIHKSVCCDHEFIAFIDKKGKIRGYESIDMEIDLAEYIGRSIGSKIYLRDLITKYGDYAVAAILHAMVLHVPVVLLKKGDDNVHISEINTLFNEFLPSTHKFPLMASMLDESDYKKAAIDDSLVLSPQGLIANTPWSDIALTYEVELLKKALDILDDDSQAVIVEQELDLVYQKADFVKEVISNKDSIYEDDLKELIRKEFSEKNVEDYDIMFLKQILKSHYKISIAKIKIRSFDKLKEGLW
jgi:hypothetical protein